MRDIKFRAWDSKDRKMVGVGAMDWSDGRVISTNYPHGKLYDAPEDFGGAIKLMQYTGLKDKNGVEIYEGDIVRCTTRKKLDKRKLDENFVSEVFWDIDAYLVHDSPNSDSLIGSYDGNNKNLICPVNPTMEIIGNIYENPELMGGNDE